MVRLVVFFALLTLLPFSASAEFYRCRDARGTLVVTDDPARFPPSCVVEARPAPKGWASFVEISGYDLRGYIRAGIEDVVARAEQKRQLVQEFRQSAMVLVSDYQQARYIRLHSNRPRQRRNVSAIIREIQDKRDSFLEELAEANIPTSDREEIEQILGPIEP